MKKIIATSILCGVLATSMFASNNVNTKEFDQKMIKLQEKMVSSENYKVNRVSIDSKKMIDKKWAMYTFRLSLLDKKTKRSFMTPMIIFTDGKYETNSLVNIETGERYEVKERRRIALIEKEKNKKKNALKNAKRENFEKAFVLSDEYYDKEHLISGDMNAKNKVIMISDPLCVACIGSFPPLYNSLKDNKDYAFFYYHYPLKRLHPTAEIVSKAMKLATEKGIKEVESKIFTADFNKIYNVYKVRDNAQALREANKAMGTNLTMKDVQKVSLKKGNDLANAIKLTGTPSIVYNGSIYKSRQKLAQDLSKTK